MSPNAGSEGRGERLQKILSRAGIASRRKAEELIREGRVTINGEVATVGDVADAERDAIKVDGKRVQPRSAHRYLLLNKPAGVVSTRSDPEGRPTVLDLVPAGLRKGLLPVGRLDFNTEGLLLLTDDGDFAQRIAHPRYGCKKTYEVKVKGSPEPRELEKLRLGIVLEGKRTRPARVEHGRSGARGRRPPTANTWLTVELSEGRTRQIREMFFRIGHPVQRLRRVAIGPLRDPKLRLGALRELSEEEVENLRGAGRRARKGGGRSGKKGASGKRRRGRSAGTDGGGGRARRGGGGKGRRA